MIAATADTDAKLVFASDASFQREVKRRVLGHFERARLSSRGGWRMFTKTAVLLVWFSASYALLVFVASAAWQGVALGLSLALAAAGVGFSVQHDANHDAYSARGLVNRVMGMTLDMLGASSYVWRFKHNVAHHTYTNVAGADDDINLPPLARLSPAQPRRRIHRLQQFYLWLLYGLLIPKWHLVYDVRNLVKSRVGRTSFPRPRGWSLVQLIAGKLAFVGWAFVIPMIFHPWWIVLLYYAGISFVLGLILSVVFQLAHCVEEAEFPVPDSAGHRLPHGWAVHQVQTTVDFAPTNRFLGWYLGGLNFQIEHHLFPRICHIHYASIAVIVREVCREFGVRYSVHQRLGGALAAHWRWLRQMGRPVRC